MMDNMERLLEAMQKLEEALDCICTAYEMIDEIADEYGYLDDEEREALYENLMNNDAFCFPIRDDEGKKGLR